MSDKAQFWQRWAGTPMNPRQTAVLNHVLDRAPDGRDGKLTNARWASIGKCSADTALRDINHLLARGVLLRLEGGGGARGKCWSGKPESEGFQLPSGRGAPADAHRACFCRTGVGQERSMEVNRSGRSTQS